MGAPSYTPIAALQGEIGTSSVRSRDMRTKISYVKHVLEGNNQLLRAVFEEMFLNGKNMRIIKIIKEYKENLNIRTLEQIKSMSAEDIRRRVNKFENERWIEEVLRRTTLELYKQKTEIKEEAFYDNTWESVLVFRARTNTLNLNWRNRFSNGDITCKICNSGDEETLKHFICECLTTLELRQESGINNYSLEEILLFKGENTKEKVQIVKTYLRKIWRDRKRKVEEITN